MFALVSAASADSVSYTYSIAQTKTNWVQNLTVPQFDPALGTLTSVVFEVSSSMLGKVGLENMADLSEDVSYELKGIATVSKGVTALLAANPTKTDTANLSAFDDDLDWGGTSGTVLTFTVTDLATTTLSSGFGDYLGTGTYDLTAAGTATSVASGTGNVASYFKSEVGADVKVTYNYLVPEPGALLPLVTGLVGLAGYVTRRRK